MLDQAALQKLRDALTKLRQSQGQQIPREVLATLTDILPDGLGLTIDFEAAATLGTPLVVLRPSQRPDLGMGLSPREREVAGLLANGLRNKDIALALGISLSTVKDHVHHILDKTGADSRAGVAAMWARHNR